MITAGIDVGNQTAKIVLLAGDGVVAHVMVPVAGNARLAAERGLEQALAAAGLTRDTIAAATATGVGRNVVAFATGTASEISCNAKGAVWLYPEARTVVDIGAENFRGSTCDDLGDVVDFVTNDKCAAGVGSFLEAMAKALEVSLAEMGPLSLRSTKELGISTTCAVFAESEVISLVHRGLSKVDILRGIHDSIASRTSSALMRIGVEEQVVMVGGVAKNVGVVESLQRMLGFEVTVPDNPHIIGALGAALRARNGNS